MTVRRVTRLADDEIVLLSGLRVTSACRTLFDIAGALPMKRLELAFEDALRRGLAPPWQLEMMLRKRNHGVNGVTKLRSLMNDDAGQTATALEVFLKQAMRDGRLPPASLQHSVLDGEMFVARVDFAYPSVKVAIEADSFRWHWSRAKWNKDIARRRALERLGWRVIQVTKWQLDHDRDAVIADIDAALRERGYYLAI